MHSFIQSTEPNKCAKCHRLEVDHTDMATCEACPNVGPCDLYPDIKGMLLCLACINREELIRISPEKQQERVDAHKLIVKSQQIDNSIQVSSDIFNATTISIQELKTAIDSDDSITNKHFKLAEVISERVNHLKKVIFELNQQIVDKASEQRSYQTYLNDLSNKLRADEREKIKLQDITYKPQVVKTVKPRGITVKKFDKTEIRKYAQLVGVPDSVLQMICISKNLTPELAAKSLGAAIASTKSE